MAKSGRKRKKAEKSKVQLKKGKKSIRLPKGLNVTDSRVTTKKIQIVNQLGKNEPEDSEPVSRKHIGFRDLMTKLHSQSGSIRADGLDGLAEILKSDQAGDLFDHSLSRLIHKLAPLTNDQEGKIRRTAIALLGQIVKQANMSDVTPFFPILNAHLCCGLSHLNTIVQRDSLRMLDELSLSLPLLVVKNFDQILPNCLNLISTKKSSQDNRTLSSNVDDRISSLQLRQEVLDRVYKTFQIVVDSQNQQGDASAIVPRPFGEFYMDLKCPNRSEVLTMSDLQNNYMARNFWQETSKSDGPQNDNWVNNVVSLLLDTWSEALLSTSNNKSEVQLDAGKPISPEIAPVLHSCLKSLTLVLKFSKNLDTEEDSKMSAFREIYEAKITDKILQKFPYQLLKQRQNDKKNESKLEYDIVQFNLEIIEMWIHLTRILNQSFLTKALNYLQALLNQEESPKLVSQVSGILLQMAKHSMPNESIGQFKLLTQEITQRHPSNFKLMELIGVLLTTPGEFDDICGESWVKGLVDALKSGTATLAQRHVAKQLLKRSNQTFMKLLPHDWNYSLIGAVK